MSQWNYSTNLNENIYVTILLILLALEFGSDLVHNFTSSGSLSIYRNTESASCIACLQSINIGVCLIDNIL